MNANTKRHSNHLQCAAILRGVIITAFLAVAGLSYVYLKNQLHNSGTQRRALEQELTELINKNNALETQIAGLTSRTALQKRLDEGFIKLVPINSQAIVRIPRTREGTRWAVDPRTNDSQIRTVSHESETDRIATRR